MSSWNPDWWSYLRSDVVMLRGWCLKQGLSWILWRTVLNKAQGKLKEIKLFWKGSEASTKTKLTSLGLKETELFKKEHQATRTWRRIVAQQWDNFPCYKFLRLGSSSTSHSLILIAYFFNRGKKKISINFLIIITWITNI